MKRFISLMLVFFLSCAFNSRAAEEATVERGRDLLKHGSYKEASAVFTALLAKDPANEQAQQGLLRVMFETGDYAAAEAKAKEYSNARPSDAWLKVLLGEVELATGRYGDAAARFERASQDAKGALALRAGLGQARALARQGREDAAQAALERVVRYAGENAGRSAEELTVIAEALVMLDRVKEAPA